MPVNNNSVIFKQIVADYKQLLRKAPDIVGVIGVELFKQSFQKRGEIQGTSVKTWKNRGFSPKNRSGAALLKKSGQLQRSIAYRKGGRRTTIYTNEAYAKIQNDGGTIAVTTKMRRYFYAMYKQTDDPFWKRMFTARKITIPARPFIYDTPELGKRLDAKFIPLINQIVNKS